MNGIELRAVLAQNIKAFRARRNWSQADLAEKSELSVVYLSDIERGNNWPYLDTLVKLAQALEIEVYELLQPTDTPGNINTSAITRYTAEANAIINKSMETIVKDTAKLLTKLKDQYTTPVDSRRTKRKRKT